jgi:hypothetical protein
VKLINSTGRAKNHSKLGWNFMIGNGAIYKSDKNGLRLARDLDPPAFLPMESLAEPMN